LNLRSGNLTRTSSPAGAQTISAGIVLGDPTGVAAYGGNWNIAGATALVVSGDISEAGGPRGLTLSGIGSIRLSGNNTFSGGLTMNNSGSVYVTSDANLGASGAALNLGGLSKVYAQGSFTIARALNIGAGGTGFYVDAGNVVEISGAITGNDLLFAGQTAGVGGTLVLSGSGSNGTGITQVWGGTISYRGSVGIGTGILEIAQGGIVELGNSNLTRPLGNQAGQVWMSITGSSGFAAWGADRIVNFGGTGATVTWGSGAFIPNGASLLLGSSTGNATLDFQNDINLGTATRTIQVQRGTGTGADGKLSGVISGNVSLNIAKNGTEGRLLLTNGNNSYSGSTNIFGGELWLGANATSGAGNTVLGSGSAPVELGKISGSDNASLMAAAPITIGRNILVLSGNTGTSTLGGVTADDSTFSGTITLGTNTTTGHALTLRAATGGTVTFSGTIADPAGLTGAKGAITKAGTGTVVLSGSNTYAGTTTVNEGALNLRSSTALGSTAGGTTVNSGSEIQLQGGIAIGGELLTLNGTGASGSGALRNMSGNNSWAGNIVLASSSLIQTLFGQLTLSGILSNGGNGSDFQFDGAGNTLVLGSITNNADVIKNGTGLLTLQGANTYTGGTFVNGGTLLLTGSLNGTSGTALTFGGDSTFKFNAAAGTAQGMGQLTFGAGDGTVESVYGGSGNTSLTFSSLAPRAVGATGNFVITGGTNGTTNKIVLTGQPSGFIDTATFFNGDEYAYVDPTGYVRGIDYGVDPGTAVSNGGVSLSGDHVKANGHINSQGTQRFETLHLASNIQYTLGSNQKVTVSGILKTGNVPGGATISGGSYLQADPNAEMTIRTSRENDFLTIVTPIVANGNNAVTKTGAGTLTLSGVNTYTGGTYVTDGTLKIGANERLLNTGAVTVAGGTFDLQNFTETVGSVVLSSGVISGSGTGTLIGSSYDVRSGSASAILAGPSSLTKNTDGTVTLTGANTYTGTTTVNAGQLIAAAPSGSALGSTTALIVNPAGNITLGANNQINNAAPVTLAGGTLSTGGFSEGTQSSAGAGALNLTATGSTIDFGTGGTGTLAFSIFNPGSYFLTINNWTGTPGVLGDGTTDQLIFATDPTPNLGSFNFTGYEPGGLAVLLPSGFYEVTPALAPVPEMNPTVAAAFVCLFGLLATKTSRRKLRHLLFRQRTQ
jgi:autotransporter-associated beta strand protein